MDFKSFFKKKSTDKIEPVKAIVPERMNIIREEIEELIKTPKLELTCVSSKNEKEKFKIILTPNSINDVIKKGEKFRFGRGSDNNKNDYNFPEDSIGNKKFEINYDKCKYMITKQTTNITLRIVN
jgi:hypothetical protein